MSYVLHYTYGDSTPSNNRAAPERANISDLVAKVICVR
jgi:hypothetical protein